MILFVSGRCDIPAHFSAWFFNRLKAGFVDVRNPFAMHQISRIQLNEQNIDVIVFCTKNPLPMLTRLDEIPFPYLFHITFTPYKEEIEHVPDKRLILKAIRTLSSRLGADRVVVRYDPIFLSETYTLEYHKRAFMKLCREVTGYVNTIIISFVDMYKNTRMNQNRVQMRELKEEDMHRIGECFGSISKAYGICVQTCAEKVDLSFYGIEQGACFDRNLLRSIAGHSLSHIKSQGVRHSCDCMASVDIGDYNCCAHRCSYCYANYDEAQICARLKLHNPDSSVLLGHLSDEDHIVERKECSVKQEALL